ncbi:MAG: SPOR domain-containing protein [Bacteroidaceae bacterium]|nr:SPOR domain-containing protein [Bacteroidaceae bacterium]
MKRTFFIFTLLCASILMFAQGSVTTTQSSAISDLVNPKKQDAKQKYSSSGQDNSGTAGNTDATSSQSTSVDGTDISSSTTTSKPRYSERRRRSDDEDDESGIKSEKLKTKDHDFTAIDSISGPKVMRGDMTAKGWRVQVYTGGNKRTDRQNAEEAGNRVKSIYPSLPVYVHFYPPRWMARCGNFRTYKEAEPYKRELIKKGFKNACIVRAQIMVEKKKKEDKDSE